MIDKTTVGIDVSKFALDVLIDTCERLIHLENSASGIIQLLKELEGLHISGVIMEATSRYHSLAESMLISAGLPVAVINPRQIKNFARAMGKVAKKRFYRCQDNLRIWSSDETGIQTCQEQRASGFGTASYPAASAGTKSRHGN